MIGGVISSGESHRVFLNDKQLGYLWGFTPYHIDIPKPYSDKPYKLSIQAHGICGDVTLKAFVAGAPRITDAYLMTSVEKMEATIRAGGFGNVKGCGLKVIITDYNDSKKVVKTAGPFALPEPKDDGWKIEQSFAWKDPKLWTPDTPNLYNFYLEILDASGKAVDRIFPRRFGFKELKIKGGRWQLNGNPITITLNVHSDFSFGMRKQLMCTDPLIWKQEVEKLKSAGVDASMLRWVPCNADPDELFRMADEIGHFIVLDTGNMQYGDPNMLKMDRYMEYLKDSVRARVLAGRQYPSTAFYMAPVTSNCWDFEPSRLGENYDTEALFGKRRRSEKEFIKELDPVRVVYAGSGGGKDEAVHSSMNYISIDADLQVHETWPSHWYKKQLKPLGTYEMDAPSIGQNWDAAPQPHDGWTLEICHGGRRHLVG